MSNTGITQPEALFDVAIVRGKTDVQPVHEQVTLSRLVEMLTKPRERLDKDGPGVTLGCFDAARWKADKRKPGPKAKGGKGAGWRADEFVIHSSGYLGDVDNAEPLLGADGKPQKDKSGQSIKRRVDDPLAFSEIRRRLDALGLFYVMHTTFSHGADWHRVRFVIPFAAPLAPAQYKPVHELLDRVFDRRLDSRSSPAMFCYLPAVHPERADDYLTHVAASGCPLATVEALQAAAAAYLGRVGASTIAPAALPRPDAGADAGGDDPADAPAGAGTGIVGRGEIEALKVDLKRYRLDKDTVRIVELGIVDGDRSAQLAAMYLKLHKAGMALREIVAVCWNPKNRISEAVREEKRGFDWLVQDVQRVIVKRVENQRQRDHAMFSRYVYLEGQNHDHRYWDLQERHAYGVGVFIDRHRHQFAQSSDAHDYFQQARRTGAAQFAHNITYLPGGGAFVVDRNTGRRYVNKWQAPVITHVEGDVSPWLRLLEKLVPEQDAREHLLNWMAFVVQRPGVKPGHAVLMVSTTQGVGKDTLFEPLLFAVGGHAHGGSVRANVRVIQNEALERDFNEYLCTQLVVIEEVKESLGLGQKKRLSNKMKTMLAAPPHQVEINEKFTTPYQIANTCAALMFSNHLDALALEPTDRRVFAYRTLAPRLPNADAHRIWSWYTNEQGLEKVADYLQHRDITDYNGEAPAPDTDFKAEMASMGRSVLAQKLDRLIDARAVPFDIDIISTQEAAEYLRNSGTCANLGRFPEQLTAGIVATALAHFNAVPLGRCDTGPLAGEERRRRTLHALGPNAEGLEYVKLKRGSRAILDLHDAMLAHRATGNGPFTYPADVEKLFAEAMMGLKPSQEVGEA
jgi:hypothetical protein